MLNPNESSLVGQWQQQGSSVIGDEICQRIESLANMGSGLNTVRLEKYRK